MKWLLLKIVVICFVWNTFYSQETIVPLEERYSTEHPFRNLYFKDVSGYLNEYIGTWEYNTNSVYLKIQFYKIPHSKGGYGIYTTIFEDELRSFILYKVLENGIWVTKYNTFAIILINNQEANSYSIRGNFKTYDGKLSLNYTEPSTYCRRLKAADLELEVFDEDGVHKLQWHRKARRNNRGFNGLCLDGTPLDESDFIIPKDLILTKVD